MAVMQSLCIRSAHAGIDRGYIEGTTGRIQIAYSMASFSQLPSKRWFAQVRRGSLKRNKTFDSKREAKEWAAGLESQANQVDAGHLRPLPKTATVSDLIDEYLKAQTVAPRRSKAATLNALKEWLGDTKLGALSGTTMVEFVDKRIADKVGGVTLAGDLSTLSAVLGWARFARNLNIDARLATDARKALKFRGLSTRSRERDREPTEAEMQRLYAYWTARPRQRIDMPTICRFALASGMRLAEICNLQVADVDRAAKTVVIRDRKDPKEKIGNNQTVPLLPRAWEIVEPLIEGETDGKVFDAFAPSVSAAFTRACQGLGPPIIDLHFHDLRHAATTSFFRMNLSIPLVALLTGHKTWTQLKRYSKLTAGDVHLAVARHEAEQSKIVPLRRTRAARKAV